MIVERTVPNPPPATAREGRVTIVDRAPGAYHLRAESPDGGYLVLSEAWYPGWSAMIDGGPVSLLCANHLVQAVVLPPGSHDVRFVYRPRMLPWGVALALGATCVPLGLALARRVRARPAPLSPGGAAP